MKDTHKPNNEEIYTALYEYFHHTLALRFSLFSSWIMITCYFIVVQPGPSQIFPAGVDDVVNLCLPTVGHIFRTLLACFFARIIAVTRWLLL